MYMTDQIKQLTKQLEKLRAGERSRPTSSSIAGEDEDGRSVYDIAQWRTQRKLALEQAKVAEVPHADINWGAVHRYNESMIELARIISAYE